MKFIEVKSARRVLTKDMPESAVRPEENMHPGKLRRLHRAIQTYLLGKKIPGHIEWQIQVNDQQVIGRIRIRRSITG